MKKFLKDYLFYIFLLICLFGLSYFFPYTGDDWFWGAHELKLSLFLDFAKDVELNGRYLGNFLVVIMTRNKIIRGLIMSITITAILWLINTYTKTDKKWSLLLLLFLPAVIFKQVIPWSAGFANYMVSVLLLLSDLYILKFKKGKIWNIIIFFLFIASSLFIENITIFLLGLSLFLNIKYFIKNKNINYLYLLAFLGSLIGSLLMFLHPSFIAIFNGNNVYRDIAINDDNLLTLIKYNYFNVFYLYGINANYTLFMFLELILYIHYVKNLDKYSNKLFVIFGVSYLMLLYIVLTECIQVLFDLNYVNGFIGMVYLIILFCIMYVLFKGNKKFNFIWEILAVTIFSVAPLIIVSPIGPRNFLIIYILLLILILRLYHELFGDIKINKYLNVIIFLIIWFLLLRCFYIFYNVNLVSNERDDYIKNNTCNELIYVPKLPYHKYIWWPDFDGSLGNYYPDYYKKYMNLPENLRFKFLDYDDWKKAIKDVSTCS